MKHQSPRLALCLIGGLLAVVCDLSGAPAPLPRGPRARRAAAPEIEAVGEYSGWYNSAPCKFTLHPRGRFTCLFGHCWWEGKWSLCHSLLRVCEWPKGATLPGPEIYWTAHLTRDRLGRLERAGVECVPVPAPERPIAVLLRPTPRTGESEHSCGERRWP